MKIHGNKTIKLAISALISASLISSCAVLPEQPGAYPQNWVPNSARNVTENQGALSQDGFDIAQKVTLRIRNVGCRVVSTGTGFAIDDHTIITNHHVVEGAKELQLLTYDGHTISATAASTTTIADIAIVTTKEPVGSYTALAQRDVEEGDAITIVGYPLGGRMTTSSGVVLGATNDPLGEAMGQVFATTAEVAHGSSGSPVFSESGKIVGVVYAKNEAEQSFLVPVSTLRTLLEEPSLMVPSKPNSC